MSSDLNIPNDLIELERTAEAAREGLAGLEGEAWDAQLIAWWEASVAALAAVTAHAEESSQSRYKLEMAVKKAVRHPEPEPDA
ncbi:hypothetical protein [Streptomyces albireticuli]|uniref:Uncharacterized protein n=1 Tax=Streptomyces albireticuli TaxID=1940 RepID=A0A2A2D400_9ACTN|nr:hypothetical protein [Streptomyces albireticuli]MCD9196093.1 hypothetical protein [Streptomyces albireticuli]PAU46156.1 hypothetical protein CK936_25505 [Streptomyces albireticuli]